MEKVYFFHCGAVFLRFSLPGGMSNHALAHREDPLQLDLIVEQQDVGILAALQRALAVVDAHDAGRCLAGHAAGVAQRYVGLGHGHVDEAVHRGDGAGQCRAVAELAHAVLDDDSRVEGLVAVAGGDGQGVGDQCGALHAFHAVNQAQDGDGHVNAVGNHLHRQLYR